jgi:chemosensory pili system protein ChpA (sensor histidine kinase/response regulator)
VGMDVVRTETALLGGRISVVSNEGKGTQITIFLPLTLAVTQVVLVRVGAHTIALPSALVAEVQHLKAPVLTQAYNEGHVQSRGNLVSPALSRSSSRA